MYLYSLTISSSELKARKGKTSTKESSYSIDSLANAYYKMNVEDVLSRAANKRETISNILESK